MTLIESIPVSMIVTDPAGRILTMNSAARKLTLYDDADLFRDASLVLSHDLHSGRTCITRHAADGNKLELTASTAAMRDLTRLPHDEQEWVFVRKDGSGAYVNLSVKPLRASDGSTAGYIQTAIDITARKTLLDVMARMENNDQLTGLPNRLLLNDRLAQGMKRCDRFGEKMAVFVIGIDHFKRINDSMGHESADMVLKHVADQLRSNVRDSDTVARVGGDEFAILMPDFRGFDDAERCADLLQQVLAEPVMVSGHEVTLTASIGYCLYPDAADSAANLLLRAELAMHEAKTSDPGNSRAFSPEMHEEATLRLTLERELRRAVQNGEFELHYQPQIHCGTEEVTGMEMLLRWKNPTRGYVPPATFIPIAEKAGLLTAIGEWSLRKACQDLVDVQLQLGRPLTVAVNLSPSQLCQPNLIGVVAEALKESGLPAERLEIEITEQILMTTNFPVIATLEGLRQLGVRIAIDDFGVGYSSFSYIMQYSFDRLKIDRSFISLATNDMAAGAIVRTIISLAHNLGLDVVGEGVETDEQMDLLAECECDHAQGYLFSKAVPVGEFPSIFRMIDRKAKEKATRSKSGVAFAAPARDYGAVRPLKKNRITKQQDSQGKNELMHSSQSRDFVAQAL